MNRFIKAGVAALGCDGKDPIEIDCTLQHE